MTAGEIKQIRELVRECANYDKQTRECLPLECTCYMLGKCWTGAFCRWFEQAVLPLRPGLVVSLSGIGELKECTYCGDSFAPKGRQIYCSEKCRANGIREKERDRKRKQRQAAG